MSAIVVLPTFLLMVPLILPPKPAVAPRRSSVTPNTRAEKFESFERINSIRGTNGNFDSCNSRKRLGSRLRELYESKCKQLGSRLRELQESKFPFISRIEFIRSKPSNFSAHVYGQYKGYVVRGEDYTAVHRLITQDISGQLMLHSEPP